MTSINSIKKQNKIETLSERQNSDNEYLNSTQAAKYIFVSPSTLFKMTHYRKISFTKPGGKCLRFRRSDLDKWLESNRFPSIDEIKEHSLNSLTNINKKL